LKRKEGIFHAIKRWSWSAFACKETGTIMNDNYVHNIAVVDEDRIQGWEGQGYY